SPTRWSTLVKILNNADITEAGALEHNTRERVYNALDHCVTYEVRDALREQHDNTTTGTYQFSLAMQAPVLDMSMRGLLVDETNRKETLELFRARIERLENQLNRIITEGMGLELPPKIFDKKTGKWKVWWRS